MRYLLPLLLLTACGQPIPSQSSSLELIGYQNTDGAGHYQIAPATATDPYTVPAGYTLTLTYRSPNGELSTIVVKGQ